MKATQIWAHQNQRVHSYSDQDDFHRLENQHIAQGPWHMKVRSYMQEHVITAATPYLAVQKANNTLADGWEELKLTRNGEL